MLVCNVSLRPARSAIAAGIVEAITAVDAAATGNVVFATLVDDPVAVGDLVDAFVGEIMIEAASADDLIITGLIYTDAVDATATAADAVDAGLDLTDAVDETATAADAVDATIVSAKFTTTAVAGPLLEMDTTFASSSLTVIKVGS